MTRMLPAGLALVAAVLVASPASAELVFLTTGRVMSVTAYRVEGSDIVLVLRGGGEVQFPATLVQRIAPDEFPRLSPADASRAGRGNAGFEVPAHYKEMIDRIAVAHGVDPALVSALIHVESRFQPHAVSPKGAMGLMQLMPQTARELSVSNPYDPELNIDGGVRHLRALLERYDVSLALAAYNAGSSAVDQYGGIPPYRETQAYVREVMRLAGLDSGSK